MKLMENFNECVDFICKQISNQNKHQLTDEDLDSLISFLELTLANPTIRAISIGTDVVDSHLTNDDKVRIKGEHKYLGFEPNFVTLNEKDSLFDINFLNKMYGLVEISKNGKNLAMDKEGNVCYVKEKMFYLVCNA